MVKKPYELFNDFLKLFLETLKVSQSLISRNRPIKPKATERSCLSDVRRQILDPCPPPPRHTSSKVVSLCVKEETGRISGGSKGTQREIISSFKLRPWWWCAVMTRVTM